MKKQVLESKIMTFTDHIKRLKELIDAGYYIDCESYIIDGDRSTIIYH